MIEKTGIYKDHKYWVVGLDAGYRCGYVLSKRGDLQRDNYKTADILFPGIHGGITYIKKVLTHTGEKFDTNVFGFDCGHYLDGFDTSLIRPDWVEFIEEISPMNEGLHIWVTEEVEEECKKLIDLMEEKGW